MATLMCTEHNKQRTALNLMSDGKGGFCCMPGSECGKSVAEGGQECSVHGAKRKSTVLEPDGNGGMRCRQDFQCVRASRDGKMGSRPGEWRCPKCGDRQFAKNEKCRKCQAPKPSDGSACGPQPGDWDCPGCGDFKYFHHRTCHGCGHARPAWAEAAGKGQGGPWQKDSGDNAKWEADLAAAEEAQELAYIQEQAEHAAAQEAYQAAYIQGLMQAQILGQQAALEEQEKQEAVAAKAKAMESWKCSGCGNVQFCTTIKCARCRQPQPGSANDSASSDAGPSRTKTGKASKWGPY